MPVIAFWNKCDNKCVMCTNPTEFPLQDPAQYGLKSQIEKLERYLGGKGSVYTKSTAKPEFISLTGGEPSIHPDFFRLLAYFRKRLPSAGITLLSNGRRFARRSFARRFLAVASPPFSIAVPLHGATALSHDGIAGVRGAFSQTVKGLENLFADRGGQEIEVRLVIHKLNVNEFTKTLRFLLKKFPDTRRYRVVFIHYEIEGMSLANHEQLALTLSASSALLNSAASLLARFGDFRIYHLPLCLLDPGLRPLAWITLPPEDRTYTKKCVKCGVRRKCLGLMTEYYRVFGDRELKPLRVTAKGGK